MGVCNTSASIDINDEKENEENMDDKVFRIISDPNISPYVSPATTPSNISPSTSFLNTPNESGDETESDKKSDLSVYRLE